MADGRIRRRRIWWPPGCLVSPTANGSAARLRKLPHVSAYLKQYHQDGWYPCVLSIRNRLECSIKFKRAEVINPKGFLLACGQGQFGKEVNKEMAAQVINPVWEFAGRPESEHQITLYVKAPRNVRGLEAITISFRISAQVVAKRQELRVDVKSNAINWRG